MVDAAAADLLVRLGVDASGVDAEITSRLTRAERAAVASGDKIAAGVSRGADKAAVAQLRVVAATERYTRALQKEGATTGQIASAQASLIASQNAYATAAARATGAVERQGSATLTTAKHFASLGLFFGGAEALRTGVKVLEQYQANLAQTSAALRSTGGVAGVTSKDIQNLGEEVQTYSGQSREAVIHSENLLLTFTNIRNQVGKGNDVFTQATKALADLSARGFGTVETNAKALGRALQDPLSGLTLLRRSGITFTTQQQATVKSLVQQNKLLEAQKFILDTINQKVGGSARAFGQTLPGEIDRTKNHLEDVERTVIQVTEPIIKLSAAIAGFIGGNKAARELTTGFLGTVAALAVLNKGVKLYKEISENVLRRNVEKAASNVTVAESYDAVAAAAGRAAEAEGAAAAGGVAGGVGKAGVGALTLRGLATNPITGAVAALGVGSFLLNKTANVGQSEFEQLARTNPAAAQAKLKAIQAQIARVSSLSRGTGGRTSGQDPIAGLRQQASLLSKAIDDAAPEIKASAAAAGRGASGAFTAAFKASQAAVDFATITQFSGGDRAANIKQARQDLRDALQARSDAASSLAQAQSTKTTTTGKSATAADIKVAELRVQAAQEAARNHGTTASEQATLISAEQRLNQLRGEGAKTSTKTVGSERSIAAAIRSQKSAQDAVNKARKALDEAGGISAATALKKIQADASHQGQLASDVARLVARGASQQELTALKALEDQTPGTIHRIATTTGKKFNDEFNRALSKINGRKSAIEKLFDGAETVAEARGERIAAKLQKGMVKGLGGIDFRVYFTELGAAPAPTKATTRGVRNKVHAAGFGAA